MEKLVFYKIIFKNTFLSSLFHFLFVHYIVSINSNFAKHLVQMWSRDII